MSELRKPRVSRLDISNSRTPLSACYRQNKKIKNKKRRNLIRLPYPLSSSPPTHAPLFHLSLASRSEFWQPPYILHPSLSLSLFRLTYYRFLRYTLYVPSIFKIPASPVLPFPEVLTLLSVCPRVFLSSRTPRERASRRGIISNIGVLF